MSKAPKMPLTRPRSIGMSRYSLLAKPYFYVKKYFPQPLATPPTLGVGGSPPLPLLLVPSFSCGYLSLAAYLCVQSSPQAAKTDKH
jgi:hypothetical protein